MNRTPEQLERVVRQKMGARACENLMGRFAFWYALPGRGDTGRLVQGAGREDRAPLGRL